jgi:DnaJ family protein B protein 6
MATNLYEILGIGHNATTEEVRKAYRKKALETHPDRLHQGASAAEKSASEDLFRKVNNAYEVLSDPQSRSGYDQHGVWPPPTPAPQGPFANGRHGPYSEPHFRDPFLHDPFFRGARMDPFGGFGFGSRPGPRDFTDPFVLFNSIFGDLHRAFGSDPFFDGPFGRRGFGSNQYGGGFSSGGFPSAMPSPFDFGGGGMGGSMMQTFSNGGNGGGWISQSWTSSTVNGVTQTKSVRRDSQGNEHVTYRFPDGTERHTINGIEQSTSQPPRALPPSAPPAPPVSDLSQVDSMPPPPYYEAVAQPPPHSRSSRHHGHHYDHSGDRHEHRDRHRHEHGRERERDRRREHEIERGGHGYRDDRHGHDAQRGSSWKLWRS